MKTKIIAVIMVLIAVIGFAGCSSIPQQTDSTAGISFSESKIPTSEPDESSDATESSDIVSDTPTTSDPILTEEEQQPETSQIPQETEPSQTSKPAETEKPPQSSTVEEMRPPQTTVPEETKPPQTSVPDEPEQSEPKEDTSQKEPEQTVSPPTESEEPQETETSEPTIPEDTFTQADHERIISEVSAYAESYAAKGFVFEWKDSMEFSWEVGYMGTPRVEYDGVDGVIKTLKYHIDLIYQTSTNPAYGVTTDYMTYKIVQITIDGDLAYAAIYGG